MSEAPEEITESEENTNPLCAQCDDELEDGGLICVVCGDASCGGAGCGFYCASCGDWTCHDCAGIGLADNGNPLCVRCDE